jgi:hypothetical protein
VGAVKQTVAPMLGDGRHQVGRRRLLHQQRGGADPERKEEQAAQAEGERERRRAAEDVVGLGPEHVRREAVAAGEHVPVEVHRALGLAGGAGREGDQRDVVRGGPDGLELGGSALHPCLERSAGEGAEVDDLLQHGGGRACLLQLGVQAVIGQGQPDPRLGGDLSELARAEQWHRRDADPTHLQHGQPARSEHRVVRPAEQHTVSRLHPEVVAEHVRDPVHVLPERPVRPVPAGKQHGGALSEALLDPAVEQHGDAVDPVRVASAGFAVVVETWPELGGREMVAREGVHVRGVGDGLGLVHGARLRVGFSGGSVLR